MRAILLASATVTSRTGFLASRLPTQSMPGWLQAFANNQPVTMLVNAVRGLALPPMDPAIAAQIGIADTTRSVIGSLLWIAALLAVFIPLAIRGYRRASA